MEAHPSIVDEPMAVEATNESESAAAPQEPTPEVLLEDADLESPAKKRKVSCKIICTLMHVHVCHCPKHVQSESLCVRFGESLSIVL